MGISSCLCAQEDHSSNMKCFVALCALVAVASAAPRPDHGPPSYAPAPYKPSPYKEEKLPPQPYEYKYGVEDSYSGTSFDKGENQDAYGNVAGSYRVNLPDGRVQVVTYTADHENGFIADVKYEGVAAYPEAPKGGYGHPAPAPAFKPAPAPYHA